MTSNPVTPNLPELSRLVFEAEQKLERWHQKIRTCSTALEALEQKLVPIKAVLKYAEREDERKKLIGLFFREGEYGLPTSFPADVLSSLQARADELEAKVKEFKDKREVRKRQVEFIQTDIDLLKQVHVLTLERDHYELAVLDV